MEMPNKDFHSSHIYYRADYYSYLVVGNYFLMDDDKTVLLYHFSAFGHCSLVLNYFLEIFLPRPDYFDYHTEECVNFCSSK